MVQQKCLLAGFMVRGEGHASGRREGKGEINGGRGKSGVDGCLSLIEGRVGLWWVWKSWNLEEMAIGAEGQQQQTRSVRRRGIPWHCEHPSPDDLQG